MKVACIGMGWWSDVLADAIKRSGKLDDRRLLYAARRKSARSSPPSTAAAPQPSYEEMLARSQHRGDHQHHAERRAPRDHARRGRGRQARLPRQADRQHDRRCARAHRRPAARQRWCSPSATSAGVKATSAGSRNKSPRARFGKLVNAEANISRDRLGKIDLSSWRYTAEGMPGGVMLQIGIHYTDVLEYLLGPVKAVSGQFARLVLPGDNPDVASLVLEHENGALSTLNASYASASEYYLMNIYGKEATAYYDLHHGLRVLKRGDEEREPGACEKNDTDRRGARGVRARGARRRRAGNGRRARHRLARGDPRRHPLGAGRTSGRSEGDPGMKIAVALLSCLRLLRLDAHGARTAFPQRGPIEITVLFPAGILGRRHRAHARRRHVEARSGQRVLVVNRPGAGGAIGYKYVRGAEAGRLFAGVELELDLDHLSFRPARVRLPGVRRRGAGAGRVGRWSRCAPTRAGRH